MESFIGSVLSLETPQPIRSAVNPEPNSPQTTNSALKGSVQTLPPPSRKKRVMSADKSKSSLAPT